MANTKRPRSDKQLANDQRLKDEAAARREAKNQNLETKSEPTVLDAAQILGTQQQHPLPEAPPQPEVEPEAAPQAPLGPLPDTIDTPDYGDLVRQINEMKAYMFDRTNGQFQPPTQGASVANGKVTGSVTRYALDPANYPSPNERLAKEAKLERFAFSMNYELDYIVGESSYTNIDNIRVKEPKFTLTLVKIMLDEDTGLDTGGRYDICRIILHEDPDTALIVARENGVDVIEGDEKAFLNEMRYIRMRDWLLECFYPPKATPEKQKRDMVINGKLVQYWEKNVDAESGKQGIGKQDWDNLPKVRF
jgi:hypothetical protein